MIYKYGEPKLRHLAIFIRVNLMYASISSRAEKEQSVLSPG